MFTIVEKEMYNELHYSSDIISPDSNARYCQPWYFFYNNEDKKGCFFIIELKIAQNYTWEEIRKNKLYETMIVTKEILKNSDWKVDYYLKRK